MDKDSLKAERMRLKWHRKAKRRLNKASLEAAKIRLIRLNCVVGLKFCSLHPKRGL